MRAAVVVLLAASLLSGCDLLGFFEDTNENKVVGESAGETVQQAVVPVNFAPDQDSRNVNLNDLNGKSVKFSYKR